MHELMNELALFLKFPLENSPLEVGKQSENIGLELIKNILLRIS